MNVEEEALCSAALQWWAAQQSRGMTVFDHLRDPYHNLDNSIDKHLADAVAGYLRTTLTQENGCLAECGCCHQVIGLSEAILQDGQELCKACAAKVQESPKTHEILSKLKDLHNPPG